MKILSKNNLRVRLSLVSSLLIVVGSEVNAQGDLEPPVGIPRPSQKSLLEIWNKVETLEGRIVSLNDQMSDLRTAMGAPFVMEMVTVGNPGNVADRRNRSEPGVYGAVGEEFRIGKYEVTNGQYAQFLNAIAASDPNACYQADQGSHPLGGILRKGNSGSYIYLTRPWMRDKPVNFITWYSALRFCNWLHNGRPVGDQNARTTEDGAYTFSAAGGVNLVLPGTHPDRGSNGRNAGARFWLPDENEWYKAAYHSPGQAEEYWLYPSQSDNPPTQATADLFGNIDIDSENVANYGGSAIWNYASNGYVTTVGSGGEGNQSYYGAFDLGGNLAEWTEALTSPRVTVRGGSFLSQESRLESNFKVSANPTFFDDEVGFRVAGPLTQYRIIPQLR